MTKGRERERDRGREGGREGERERLTWEVVTSTPLTKQGELAPCIPISVALTCNKAQEMRWDLGT
jgi:hypothetical protein